MVTKKKTAKKKTAKKRSTALTISIDLGALDKLYKKRYVVALDGDTKGAVVLDGDTKGGVVIRDGDTKGAPSRSKTSRKKTKKRSR